MHTRLLYIQIFEKHHVGLVKPGLMWYAICLTYALHVEWVTCMLCAGKVLLSSAMALQPTKNRWQHPQHTTWYGAFSADSLMCWASPAASKARLEGLTALPAGQGILCMQVAAILNES